MTKSELIDTLSKKQSHLPYKDVHYAVKVMLEHMTETLASGERIEIRGFGSFSLSHRPSRIGQNPKTGESVSVASKYVPRFKYAKELNERVNKTRSGEQL